MADNRKIISTVRAQGASYGPGKEDELELAISPETGKKLIESGALSGDWDFDGDDEVAPPSELEGLRVALEESGKTRDSLFQRNTQLSEANADLIKANAGMLEDLRSAQIEADNAEAKIAELMAQVETLKADLEKAQKPKTATKTEVKTDG